MKALLISLLTLAAAAAPALAEPEMIKLDIRFKGVDAKWFSDLSAKSKEILRIESGTVGLLSPLIPPPGYVRRPRKSPADVQLDLILVERIRPSALGFNQIADGGKRCPSRGRIGGRLSRLPI